MPCMPMNQFNCKAYKLRCLIGNMYEIEVLKQRPIGQKLVAAFD